MSLETTEDHTENDDDSSDESFAEDVFELANMSLLDTAGAPETMTETVAKILGSISGVPGDARVCLQVNMNSGIQKLHSVHITFD